MACFKLSKSSRLLAIIAISFAFFLAEISVGFSTHSLALIADSFHYMSDLIGFVVALVALKISEREDSPSSFSFGWQRIQILGAFFNGVFLVALGLSIFLQSIERFISIRHVRDPTLVLIMGCVGLTLNIISALFLHEHHHDEPPPSSGSTDDSSSTKSSPVSSFEMPVQTLHHAHHCHTKIRTKTPPAHGHDLNMAGVFLHLLGDAVNNLGIIVAALIILLARSSARFYADPGISMAISFVICVTAYPLVSKSGSILLQSAPLGVDLVDVKKDLESIPGVIKVHELHVWRLSQWKSVATAHLITTEKGEGWERVAEVARECLCAYGVNSATLQPEMVGGADHHREGGGMGASGGGSQGMFVCVRGEQRHFAAGDGRGRCLGQFHDARWSGEGEGDQKVSATLAAEISVGV
ncbi:MAG: hypothetical protein LQ349_001643 [Xanthoria aureola]|nr:MAG: hypothetical protein LQ349_001643 [Xanthoria aureola]